MNKRLFASLPTVPLVAAVAAAWLPACGETASLVDRQCPCEVGWTCCSINVCVANASECPAASDPLDAGVSRDASVSKASADAGHDTGSSVRDAHVAPPDAMKAVSDTGSIPDVSLDGGFDARSEAAPPDAGGPRILVTGQSVACITSDATNLYWINTDGALVQVAESDGNLTVLTTGPAPSSASSAPACGLARSGSDFYFVSQADTFIETSPVLGPPIVARGASSVLATGTGSVWITQPSSNEISECAVPFSDTDACSPGVILDGLSQPDNLLADAENLYWIDRGDGSIMKSSKTHFAARLVYRPSDAGFTSGALEAPQQLALATTPAGVTRLAWTTLQGAAAVNADGTDFVAIGTNPHSESGAGVATDGVNVYWTNGDGLEKAPVEGGSVAVVAPQAMVAGDSFVYLAGGDVYWQDSDDNVWVAPK